MRGGRESVRQARAARAKLAERLRERRAEIEQAVLTRVHAISDPSEVRDLAYVEGLRNAVSIAIEHGLAGIEAGERTPPPPPALLVQARLAARTGVGLDAVLRRYFAGYALLGDFLVEEAERGNLLDGAELKGALRAQATVLDGLLAAVSEEHGRERSARAETAGQRRAERVRRLLAGELVDLSKLDYDLEARHLGAAAMGSGAEQALRDLAAVSERRLLLVAGDGGRAWAWLGGHRPFEREEVDSLFSSSHPSRAFLALGEPAEGLAGWRLTHRQALAALAVAQRGSRPVVRYADVALLAFALGDQLLSASLRQLYIEPLEQGRDGGETLRETLRAYFAADRNVTAAAAALGVDRKTVNSRLRTIEHRVGGSLPELSAALEVALGLEDLNTHNSHFGEQGTA